jgi:hypothetical protein
MERVSKLQWHRGLWAIAAYLLVCGLGVALHPQPASTAPPDKGVVVTNSAANPVPVSVTGTATVQGAVGLSQDANTVKLDSTQNTVRVGNSTADPVPVRDTSGNGRPFQTWTSLFFDGTTEFGTARLAIPLDVGERFLIEDISCHIELPSGSVLSAVTVVPAHLSGTGQGSSAPHYLPVAPVGVLSSKTYLVGGRHTALVHEKVLSPGGSQDVPLVFTVSRQGSGAVYSTVAVSGHILPAE